MDDELDYLSKRRQLRSRTRLLWAVGCAAWPIMTTVGILIIQLYVRGCSGS